MNGEAYETILCISMASIPAMVGVMLALMPYLQRRGEAFAVTAPTSQWRHPQLVSYRRTYAAVVVAVTALSLAVTAALAAAAGVGAALVAAVAATFVLLGVGYALMLRFRSKVRDLKRREGWETSRQQASALIGEPDVPRGLSMTWNVLYVPVILATAVIAVVVYPSLPDMVPMHAGFDGTVDSWTPKSLGVVAFPIVVQVFLAACMIFAHWSILRSKKWSEPGAPATSAYAYGLFARANTAFLLVIGLVLAAGVGILFELSSVGVLELAQAGFILVALAIVAIVGAIALGVVYGQSGSRVFQRMEGSDVLLADDDAHWKFGVFYWNSDDASICVPKRFGIGWTINFARPAAWAIIAAGALATAAFIAACIALT